MKTDRGLLSILAGSLLVQGLVLFQVREMDCVGDACMFIHCAQSLLDGDGWDYAGPRRSWDVGHTPPLYVFFLMAHLFVFGAGIVASKVMQLLLVVGMARLSYGVAKRAWGRGAGLWAAALVGFYPNLIGFAHYNFNEIVYTFLLLLALTCMWTAAHRDFDRRVLVAAGIVFGLATLTREVTWYMAPIVAAWAAVQGSPPWRHGLTRFAAVAVPVVLIVLPWSAYNTQRFGSFLLLSTNAGNVLYHNQNTTAPENYDYRAGRVAPEPYPEAPRRRCGMPDRVANYRCEVANARAYMRAYPGRVLSRAVPKLAALVNPASFPVRFLRRGLYGPAEPSAIRAATVLTAGSFMVLTLLGAAALWLGPVGPERRLTVLVLLFSLAIVAVTFGMSRYRIPLMPLIAIQAASGLADPRRLIENARVHWRAVGLIATLTFLGWSWATYLPLITDVF